MNKTEDETFIIHFQGQNKDPLVCALIVYAAYFLLREGNLFFLAPFASLVKILCVCSPRTISCIHNSCMAVRCLLYYFAVVVVVVDVLKLQLSHKKRRKNILLSPYDFYVLCIMYIT